MQGKPDMTIYATNGAKLYIGAALSVDDTDLTVSDFSAQSWTEIGEVEALGTVGDSSEAIEFIAVGYDRKRRLKGSRDAGTMEVVCGIDPNDPGQIALIAAERTDSNYAFKIVLNDAPQGGTPSERYFAAMVGSAAEAFDSANNVMKLNASLWVNSNVVKVNAAA